MARNYGAVRGLSRFEGFTDGVFAIALTLLIVEIKPLRSVATKDTKSPSIIKVASADVKRLPKFE